MESRGNLVHRLCYFRRAGPQRVEILSVDSFMGVKCPHRTCKEALREKEIHDLLNKFDRTGQEWKKFSRQVNRIILEEMELLNGKRFHSYDCFACGAPYKRESEKDRKTLCCSECKLNVCGLCGGLDHRELTCEENKKLEKKMELKKKWLTREEFKKERDRIAMRKLREMNKAQLKKIKSLMTEEENDWIGYMEYSRTGTVVVCPVCTVTIEKNGGCNHMKCTQCNRDFTFEQAPKVMKSSHYLMIEGSTRAKTYLQKLAHYNAQETS